MESLATLFLKFVVPKGGTHVIQTSLAGHLQLPFEAAFRENSLDPRLIETIIGQRLRGVAKQLLTERVRN